MSAQDHFAEFVDRLAANLDAAVPARAADLAASVHLSRSHFERVIAAVAGESPTRFRSRVLMERAAYRMIVTDDTLLDIATAAGFTSHEAFTRAFRRAYGLAPSTWRKRPTKFQLGAASGVHFRPPGGLRIPARQRMDGMELLTAMVTHHVWVVEQLVERAGQLTDEQLDAPLPARVEGIDGESLRWVLSRLVGQMGMWCAAMDDTAYDFAVEEHESAAAMRERVAVTGPRFVGHVQAVAAQGGFDETFVEAFSPQPMVMTYGAMVAHVLTFAAHHRLLAVARLRELGVTNLALADPKYWLTEPLRREP